MSTRPWGVRYTDPQTNRPHKTTLRLVVLAAELKAAMKASGATTRELARLSGLSPAALNRTMNAKRCPTVEDIASIGVVSGIPRERREYLAALALEARQLTWIHPHLEAAQVHIDVEKIVTKLAVEVKHFGSCNEINIPAFQVVQLSNCHPFVRIQHLTFTLYLEDPVAVAKYHQLCETHTPRDGLLARNRHRC